MTKIVQKDDPVLRKIAEEIPLKNIGDKRLNDLISEMRVALDKCVDGVALAAPQIGKSLRLFVISPKVFSVQRENEKTGNKNQEENDKLVYINPVITKKSSKKNILDEGCLSVSLVFGKIKRHNKVTITAYDEIGTMFTRGASGLLAEIFQHETDHLNGILFIDSATGLIKIENKEVTGYAK